jgi:hypothetical protein
MFWKFSGFRSGQEDHVEISLADKLHWSHTDGVDRHNMNAISKFWKFSGFRSGQEDHVEISLAGKTTLVIY